MTFSIKPACGLQAGLRAYRPRYRLERKITASDGSTEFAIVPCLKYLIFAIKQRHPC